MPKIYLYNSLSRKKEEFKPLKENKVGLYTCGPTVYNFAHIGNLRSYIFADILVRTLRYNYGADNVTWVMNITDVDDKTIRDSKIKYPDLPPMEALKKFTAEFEKYFWADLAKLNIAQPDVITHAADIKYINAMQALVKKIYEAGFAYIKDGSVYFDVVKYGGQYKYGRLVEIDAAVLKSGTRIDADEYEKENIQDFVLWKGQKEGEPSWDFILNNESLPGRPGWHIECSAMGEAELGCPFDIHTGGIDLKFPHHENEIHQSVVGYGAEQPVNYWLHNDHLLVDGQRMGKRFNNFYTVKDLEDRGINPLAYRFLCLQTNYGKQMNFTWEALQAAEDGLDHLYNQARDLVNMSYVQIGKMFPVISPRLIFSPDLIFQKYKNEFTEAVNDDLNMPKALAVLQKVFKSDMTKEEKLNTVVDFDKILGLNIENELYRVESLPDEVKNLQKAREEARAAKDFAEADRLRAAIDKLGYIVEDTKDGQRIIKK